MSIEVQADPAQGSDKTGGSPKGEVPASTAGSPKGEEAEKGPQEDDTAPTKEPDSTIVSISDITGHEPDSISRKFADCFSDDYHQEWAGIYHKGFAAFADQEHMMWHQVSYFTEPHLNYWYQDSER